MSTTKPAMSHVEAIMNVIMEKCNNCNVQSMFLLLDCSFVRLFQTPTQSHEAVLKKVAYLTSSANTFSRETGQESAALAAWISNNEEIVSVL
jgi:hypothetical protein